MLLEASWWQQAVLEAMQPGAIGVVLLTVVYWLWNERQRREEAKAGKTTQQADVVKAGAVEAAEGLGLVDEWKDVVAELKAQNALLRSQNQTLIEQNELLRERRHADALQSMLALSYIDDLRLHINYGKPPPPPPWPEGLERSDYRSNPRG